VAVSPYVPATTGMPGEDGPGIGPPIRITPNPARAVVHLRWEEAPSSPVRIRLFDVRGGVVPGPWDEINRPDGAFSLEVGGLSAGVYLLQVRTAQGAVRTLRMVRLP
jgi:hypothetical protein